LRLNISKSTYIKAALLFTSAVILATPFILPSLFIFAWFAFVPLLHLLNSKRKLAAFLYSFVFGVIFFTITLYWIATTVADYGGLHWSLSLIINLLLAGYLALYSGVYGLVFAKIQAKWNIGTSLIISPFLWVLLEFLRGHLLTGFPWNILAYSQHKFLSFIQISELTGAYGVSWLLMGINCLIYWVFLNRHAVKKSINFASIGIVSLVIITIVFGFFRLNSYPINNELKIGIIQGCTDFRGRWERKDYSENLEGYSKYIRETAEKSADLSVISESAIRGYIYSEHSPLKPYMKSNARELGIDILYGTGLLVIQDKEQKYYNSAVLTHYDEKEDDIYKKQHLVPFGEYVPLKKILKFVRKFSQFYIGETERGSGPYLLTTSNGYKFGTGICYEIIFPELMREFIDAGAQFLVTITNDTWYGKTVMPAQHFNIAVFRAVENRKYIVRAANSGYSGVIAPDGRILSRTGLYERTTLIARIHPNDIETVYSKFGDWFVFVCFGFTILILLRRGQK